MKRLKIKQWLCVLSVTVAIALFQGCEDEFIILNPYDLTNCGFIELEQVVELGTDTKSFRIRVKWIEGDLFPNDNYSYPRVCLDTTNTTAVPGEHFVNYVHPVSGSVGYFTPIDSDKTYMEKEVKLLPENITNEIVICYEIRSGPNFHHLIRQHKVILKPTLN